jgi:serine phosphatase RsbU (regulator of sigma subunit)
MFKNYKTIIMHKSLALFIVLLTCSLNVLFTPKLNSQSREIDSLRNWLHTTKSPLGKYDLYIQLAKSFERDHSDSCSHYFELAEEQLNRIDQIDLRYEFTITRSTYLFDNTEYDKAISVLQSLVDNFKGHLNSNQLTKIYSSIGNCYYQKENLVMAISYFKQALENAEKSANTNELATLYGRLGNVYFLNESHREAINHYRKAGHLFKGLKNDKGQATTTMNIGNCYKQLGKVDSAIVYYTDAYIQFRIIKNASHNEAQCLANIGNLNVAQKKYDVALQHLLNANELFAVSQNKYSISLICRDLAILYMETGEYNLAKLQIDKGIEIAKENSYENQILSFYRLNWNYYEKIGQIVKAYDWLRKYMEIKDSIYYKEKQENVDKLLLQFETEQKVKEIELLKQSKEITQLKLRRKTLIQYFMLFSLILVLLLAWFLYRNVLRRKAINQLLSYQNIEINQQKEEISSQRDEIESQRDLLQEQNNTLELFKEHTNESLRYAQSIQGAILPSEKILEQISKDYFLLIKPCELVSGDFFWVTAFDEFQIFCIADCTGHGVPGAFMSILGISALNDVVNKHRITKPSEILGHLRQSVIEAISQNDSSQIHKDGMDIAICVYNRKTRELQFAGANLSLLLVTDKPVTSDFKITPDIKSGKGSNLFEIKGDNMPVGQSHIYKPFTNHIINLENMQVSIYLASDGFADQFGGQSKVKFGAKKLKTLIITNADKEMGIQKEILENEFYNWMGANYQIDDVAVLGIRV